MRNLNDGEFNHLRVENLNDFLENCSNNTGNYESPFSILSELEKQVKYENNPEKCILIPYKDGGDVIFDFEGFDEIYFNRRVVIYSFRTFIS